MEMLDQITHDRKNIAKKKFSVPVVLKSEEKEKLSVKAPSKSEEVESSITNSNLSVQSKKLMF